MRELAMRSKKYSVCVWRDDEQIKLGDSIPAKIEKCLEHSRVLSALHVCQYIRVAVEGWHFPVSRPAELGAPAYFPYDSTTLTLDHIVNTQR